MKLKDINKMSKLLTAIAKLLIGTAAVIAAIAKLIDSLNK